MKFLTSLVLAALPLSTYAAKRASSSDVYSTYHSAALSTPSLKLDDKSFEELIAQPRNHSLLACLTALSPQFGCKMCTDFKPEWELLSKSWIKGDRNQETRLLFGQLDFGDGKRTFESLRLQTAPVLFLYPPTTGPHARKDAQPVRFDFAMGAPTAEQIHGWVSRQLPDSVTKPSISRPINYVRIVTFTVAILGTLTGAFVAWPYVMPVVQNRNLWAALSVICVLLFTSGHMFNHIRSTPYVGKNNKGGISYFAGGFQNQYGMETQIVAAMYAVLSFATISLALKVPRMADARSQQVAVIVWGAVVYFTYSFLLSVFRVKNGGYPFWLPPF